MNRTVNKKAARGISLLEVLVAIVVLATGLLALAALQGSLARNAADAKVRSRVATLISNQMDDIRAGGYAALATTAGTTVVANPSADCTNPAPLSAIDLAACESAVNGLQLTTTVSEFSKSGASFAAGAPTIPTDAQFKMVEITASWTDATGATRTVEQATVLSALSLQTNSPLVSKPPGGLDQVSPKVRQDNPFEEGMIPIAIGDGSETAATNPKPVVVGTNNTLAETKFNVFTYRDEGTDGTLIQQRIETTVIGCRCNANGTSTSLQGVYTQNYRPTYWDGKRYVAPEMLGIDRPAPAGPANVAQSDLCTDCCRDHHDQSTDKVKFDPFRTDSHSHYARTTTGLVAASTGEYNESCRLIRVDGLWRVATDFSVKHVGYVATGPAKVSKTPDPSYADFYEDFIVDSLRDLFATISSDGKTFAQRYDEPERMLNDSPLDKSPANNSDNRIEIQADAADQRYLHTRALMIDHVEEEAQEAIDKALDKCTKTGDAKVECVLPHVPFTTINVTELARYGKTDANVIDVIDGGVNFNDSAITQGRVSGRATAATGQQAKATTRFGTSNSALAAVSGVDPQDETVWVPTAAATNSDEQDYVARNLTDPMYGARFSALLSGHPNLGDAAGQTNDPGVRWQIGFNYPYPCGATSNATSAVAATCQTDSPLGTGVGVTLIVSGYHYFTSVSDSRTVQCSNLSNNGEYGFARLSDHATNRVCRRYRVASAEVNGAPGRAASAINISAFPGSAKAGATEETTIIFSGAGSSYIGPNDQVNITFEFQEEVTPTAPVCKYVGNSRNVSSATWTSDCDD